MNKNVPKEQILEAQLKRKLELLRLIPERDPQSISRGRERFLVELDAFPGFGSQSQPVWLAGLFKYNSNRSGENAMSSRKQRFAFTTVMVLIVLIVMLFGGASATAYASQSALPGDVLYPVKTTLEQTRVALAADVYFRAELHLQFTQRRMDEIVELLKQGRYNDVELASSEFEYYIQSVMNASRMVLAGDPARGADLSNQVTQTLLLYNRKLQDIMGNTPEPVRPAVEKVLLASEHGAGEEIEIIGTVMAISDSSLKLDSSETTITINDFTEMKDSISQGDTVKAHVFVTANGSYIAHEIGFFNNNDEQNNGIDEFTVDGGGEIDNGNDNSDDVNGNENDEDNYGNDNGDEHNGNDNGTDDNVIDNGDDHNENNNGDDHNGNNDGGYNGNDNDESDD